MVGKASLLAASRSLTLSLLLALALAAGVAILPPAVEASGTAATAVSSGEYHTCVLTAGGNVDCWGYAGEGRSNDYTGGDATAVSAGGGHTCVLKSNGNVDCYGSNSLGQSADYTGGDATAVATGRMHTCVLKSSGNVDCYGDNTQGQAADYTGGDATAVAAGYSHTCVLRSNGNVDCYGDNLSGGGNDYTGGDATAVTAGAGHTCVLKSNGNVECYGPNNYGQGADYTGGDATAVSAGGIHTCVLRSSGNADCYGYPLDARSNDYTGGDATAVSGGGYHTCILKASGNVDCYGDNGLGQSNDYTGVVAPTAPQSLAATAGAGQITLTWQAPANDGGSAVTGYKVYRGTTAGSETQVLTGGCASLGNVLTCTDSGLGNGATRHYKVSAVNPAGEGPQSAGASATTHSPPSAPQSLTATGGTGQITLTWQAPATTGGAPVTGYKVYRGATMGSETAVTSGGCASLGNVLTCTDSGLGNGVTRHYKVSAVNAAGEGVQSSGASATTSVVAPSAPQSLQASSGVGQITLVWQPPADNGGGAITNYLVYRGTTSAGKSLVTTGGCAGLGNTLTCSDAECPNLATCHYEVRAKNSAGPGPASNEASATAITVTQPCPSGTLGVPPACVPNVCPTPVGPPGPGQLAVVCGIPVPNPVPAGVLPQCMDGVDNDGDGQTDFQVAALGGGDAQCTNWLDGNESS